MTGRTVSHYQILEKLGEGGMGVVYKAEDAKLRRPVALKFLSPQLSGIPDLRERFLTEARAAAALSHPNICTVHEIHDAGDEVFLEMEYLEGKTLSERVKEGPLEPDEAVGIVIQVADALECAHQRGVIHRDVKSANVMVTRNGPAKVMDFGLAKVQGETLHTKAGTLLGTAAYMSPEQARGEAVDARADIWSLGVVFYELLGGRRPFKGDTEVSILYSILNEAPTPLKEVRPGLPAELYRIVGRAMQKDLKARYASAGELAQDLRAYQESLTAARLSVLTPRTVLRALRRPRAAIASVLCLGLLGGAVGWYLHRQSRIRWARAEAMPEIERLLVSPEAGLANLTKAYGLAAQAEKYIGGDAELNRLLAACSGAIGITTEPPGAAVWMKEPSAPGDQWQRLGVTPIRKLRVPYGVFWWRFEKPGYETVMAVATSFRVDATTRERFFPASLKRILDPIGKVPAGMVHVPVSAGLEDFFIDRYEVTNRQYKEFVDKGGYRDRRYWKQPFAKDGKSLTWEQAMAEFVDQTGRPGPSTWHAGTYPEGQEEYPVSGVSWYEASAFAECSSKILPSAAHWAVAMGAETTLIRGTLARSWLAPTSNFRGRAPAAVGSQPSMTAYGAFDMAGNVREWCSNETKSGRAVRGGAWNDATYMWNNLSQASTFDRSPRNGFRCALYPDISRIPRKVLAAIDLSTPGFAGQKPVPDSVFEVYREQFAYDKRDLNPQLEWRNASASGWVQEKVVVDAAYGNERLPVYLFLPKNAIPPYQTVVYFAGSGSVMYTSSDQLDRFWEFEWYLAPIVGNGRAVIYPVSLLSG